MKKNYIFLSVILLIFLGAITTAQVSHPAEEIAPGTFPAGDFIYQGNVELKKAGEVFLNVNNIEANGREYAIISAGSTGGIGVGKFSIYDKTLGVSRLTVDSSGNIGIGTTSPSQKLDVAGSVKTTGMEVQGDITASGGIKIGLSSGSCDASKAGTLRYDSVTGAMEYCDGVASSWKEVGGAAGPVEYSGPLVNGAHTSDDCTAAAGEVIDDAGDKFCRFNLANCPGGWTLFKQWSNTVSTSCGGTDCSGSGGACTTGGHTWADQPIESCSSQEKSYTPYPDFDYTDCSDWSVTCYATRTMIGCY